MKKLILYFGLILSFSCVHVIGSDTRQNCIAGLSSYSGENNFGGGDGMGFGGMEADEFGGEEGMGGMMGMGRMMGGMMGNMMGGMMDMEADEGDFGMGEADEGMGGFGGVQPAAGSLSCPNGERGSILIKRVRYGTSAFPGSCQNVPFCEEKFDAGVALAKQCDGKSRCPVNTLQPKFLNCGRQSNYMLVEYECVDTWATFEICETVSTVARGASVIITSPGYLGTSKPGTSGAQMCECIIQSADKADMYLDYLQTQLASEGKHCPYEYVLLESKKNITQTENDDQLEVCGQKHVKGRWFAGTLRLTYASGGPMEQRGLLSKFTVDNLGNSPRIQLECGKVNSNGVKLQQRPKPDSNGNTQSISGSIPASVGFPPMGMPPWAMNFGNNDNNNNNNLNMGMPMFPPFPPMNPMFPEPPPSGRPPPAPRHEKPPPDFSKWNIKVNNEETPKEATGIVNFANAVFKTPAPNKPTPKANPPRRGSNPTRAGTPNRKNGAGKVMGDGSDPAVSDEKAVDRKKNASGGMVALVFGGIGSVLIIGSVGILLIHNQRKKRRRMRKQEEYASAGSASMTYGKGWDTKSVESVYATVADVDPHNHGCINPAISNDDFGMGMSNKTAVEGEDEDPSSIFGKCSDFGTYDRISLKENKEIPNPVQEIAVVEVHHVHEGHEVKVKQDEPEHSHGDGCVYAKSSKFQGENRCGECKIERPPRRKDKDNGYDNNFGVKRHQQ